MNTQAQRPSSKSETLAMGKALSRLAELSAGAVAANALVAGVNLGIFEALADGPLDLDTLAEKTQLKPVACRRLLMVLVNMELVACENGRFRNLELGQYCTSRAPLNLGPVVRVAPFDHISEFLTDALKEYSPRWQQAFGMPMEDTFASLYADPQRLRAFADLMDGFSIPQGRLIAESVDFTNYRCIMDVAGGPGGQAIQIGLAHPHLQGIIMDMEPVCVVARERIEANGLAKRFKAIAADLHAGPYPAGADVVLLGHILHDWSDVTCVNILRHCAAALPADGLLLISESILNPDYSGKNATCLKDLVMLIANEPGARERTEAEFRTLLDTTGFDVVEVIRMDAPRDLLVAKKR